MTAWLLKRLLGAAATLLGTSLVVFLIAHAVPADPVAAFVGPHTDKATRDSIRREMHLDDPLAVQYLRFLGDAARGDLGRSNVTREPVTGAILARFPATLALSLGGLLIWLAVGVPLGVLTAKYRDRPVDRVVLVLATVTVSVPTFWLGRLLQFELAYRLGWFPVAGLLSWTGLVLPAVTLGVVEAGYYARLVHGNMIEVLNQDYIRTARAKGAGAWRVVNRHALKNALIPVVTIVGLQVGAILEGALVTETVFSWPGVGKLAVESIFSRDFPVVQGIVLLSALSYMFANLLVDLVYAWLDPRISYS